MLFFQKKEKKLIFILFCFWIMHLFKRLLLTRFPTSTIHNMMNPASMFIGFISAKEFFSIINRRITENHKLNLFDINIDPVEFKMSFGDTPPSEKQKELDTYFAYCVAANLNGPQFYSPANLANGMTMLSALYFKDTMEEYPDTYFVQLLFAVYLLSFTFSSRMKVFPSEHQQENFNRFVELFFDFYKITFQQLNTKISQETFDEIKKKLLNQTSFFFLLFHFYKKLNTLLQDKSSEEDFLDRILGKHKGDKMIQAFKKNYETTKYLPHSSPLEQSVLNLVWPADILVKYVIGESSPALVVDTIISKIFPKNEIDPLVQSFLKSDDQLLELFEYLLDYKKYKYGFFAGVQNYMIKLFRSQGKEELLEDIDEMLSAIDNGEDINNFDVPETIKRESRVTERLLNFYVTLLGGFNTARGDTFYLRWYYPEVLHFFSKDNLASLLGSKIQLEYASLMLYQYNKNLYYYHYIDGNIRSGKKRFSIPTKSEHFDSPSNFTVIRLYVEGMIASFFQDLNPQETKLTVKNTQLITDFKSRFGSKISQWLKKDKADFIQTFYAPLLEQLPDTDQASQLMISSFNETTLSQLKDALYRLDFWLSYELMEALMPLKLAKRYDKGILTAIFGTIRETFFGMCLLMTHLSQKDSKKLPEQHLHALWILYCSDILCIKNSKATWIFDKMQEVYSDFQPFLQLWCQLDDNEEFLNLVSKNIQKFLSKKHPEQFTRFSGEDLVRFRGLLKNISYYNKRLIMPS